MVQESVHILHTLNTKEALIQLRSDGIIKVIFNSNVTIDIPEQEKLNQTYLELCKGEKYLFLFEAMDNVNFTKEARENAILLEEKFPAIAYGAIVKNLPNRLVANFYMKVNKPKIPFKAFKIEEEAIEWLFQQKDKFYSKND